MDRIHDLQRLGITYFLSLATLQIHRKVYEKNNIPCNDSATAHEKHLS